MSGLGTASSPSNVCLFTDVVVLNTSAAPSKKANKYVNLIVITDSA